MEAQLSHSCCSLNPKKYVAGITTEYVFLTQHTIQNECMDKKGHYIISYAMHHSIFYSGDWLPHRVAMLAVSALRSTKLISPCPDPIGEDSSTLYTCSVLHCADVVA